MVAKDTHINVVSPSKLCRRLPGSVDWVPAYSVSGRVRLNESVVGACMFLAVTRPFTSTCPDLWEVNAESIHIHPIQEARKTLVEARQALMHQLQVHEICFQISH